MLSTNIYIIKRINAYHGIQKKSKIPRVLPANVIDVAFLTLLMQGLGQLCPTAARMQPGRRFGAARQVFVAVKLSGVLTTCPYFDNILNLTFLMQVVFSATLGSSINDVTP